MTSEEFGEKFEKEWSIKTDYFNHRMGAFMEMKEWIIKESKNLTNNTN